MNYESISAENISHTKVIKGANAS